MASSVYDALGLIADLDENLTSDDVNPAKRRQLFMKHLEHMDKVHFKVPDFEDGLDWLNVSTSLSIDKQLRGGLVILDFFTYCCINCMHVLPDLEAVEEKHPLGSGVAVVGVHSAKFMNEKQTANIRSAVLRYNIKHPVVNDSNAVMWNTLGIACWPTLIFVGPSGQLLYSLVGEGKRDQIMEFIDLAKEHYSNTTQLQPLTVPLSLEAHKVPQSVLKFPGKVSFWKERSWLVISDSGSHRIVITDLSGIVKEVIGSGKCGFKDGDFSQAEFSSPQGVTFHRQSIYVADTENHAVRHIDLLNKQVFTLAGNGKQGMDKEGGKVSTDQEIASPWDLILGTSPNQKDKDEPDVLYIAMSGTHQIWVYFLEDAIWYKGSSYTKGTCKRFAGSGQEENRNNSYPEKASFAQPSGLALSSFYQCIFIADSESSSVRKLSLVDGKVSAFVGGDVDPKNLFAFGDVDGQGRNAKLQHPLGVALLKPEGPLVVADSYNHKIKLVNCNNSECTTIAGNGEPSQQLHESLKFCGLNESGGVSEGENENIIYVADTNNHAIKIINLETKSMLILPIVFQENYNNSGQDLPDGVAGPFHPLPEVTVGSADTALMLHLPVDLKPGQHINTEAPNGWKITSDPSGLIDPSSLHGTLAVDSSSRAQLDLVLKGNGKVGSHTLIISAKVFSCLENKNVCLPPEVKNFQQVVKVQ